MNKDRIDGAIKQVTGSAKEMAGKVTGDAKLQVEGKTEQVAGKVQSGVGKLKDKLKSQIFRTYSHSPSY